MMEKYHFGSSCWFTGTKSVQNIIVYSKFNFKTPCWFYPFPILFSYRKAKAGDLNSDSGLSQLARLTEIDVDEVGVVGAKSFFEAKIQEQLRTNKFHDEIRQEQEERKRAEEEKLVRRHEFQQRAAIFQQN